MEKIIKYCSVCKPIMSSGASSDYSCQHEEPFTPWSDVRDKIMPLMNVDSKEELSETLEDLKKKHPEIKQAFCDDSFFCSSDLFFIPSKRNGEYMGNTVIFIPQCDKQPPVEFFIYEGHEKSILKVLEEIALERQKLN